MADNAKIAENTSSAVYAACDEVSYSDDTAKIQLIRLVTSVTGTEGSKTINDAAELADNTTTPTCAFVGSFGHVYDGSAWDLMRGTSAYGVLCDVSRITGAVTVHGTTNHDETFSGAPIVTGSYAIAHGSNPTAVAATDVTRNYANRAGIPFVIGGHPNVQVVTARRAAADSGVTDGAIVSVSTGTKIVVTRLTVTASNANTVNVAVKVGFGTSTLTADSTTGAANVICDHEGIPPGGGFTIGDGSGILAVGADDADLRWTCDTPTGGHIIISASYYTIES